MSPDDDPGPPGAARQREFDFVESDLRGLIEDAELSSVKVGSGSVSARAMKHVLITLHGFGKRGQEVWPSIETIARKNSMTERTVKRVISALKAKSLLIVTKRRPASGMVPVNHYRIVWSELAVLVPRKPPRPTEHGDIVSLASGHSVTMHRDIEAEHGDIGAEHGDIGAEHGDIEAGHGDIGARPRGHCVTRTEKGTIYEPVPVPVPEPAPRPLPIPREQAIERMREDTCGLDTPIEPLYGLPAHDRDLPELRGHVGLRVVPAEPGELAYGLWSKLTEADLKSIIAMRGWFRAQLGVPRPVMAPTEADFLLVLSAARYALSVPTVEVRKSRVAIFVSVITRRQWRKVLRFLPDAAAELDECLARANATERTRMEAAS